MTAVVTQNKSITWTTVPNATNYEVEVNGVSQGTDFYDQPLVWPVPENTTWPVRVRGNNGQGSGPWSTPVNAAVGNLAPPPIQNLFLFQLDRGAIGGMWDFDRTADMAATGNVYVSEDRGESWQCIGSNLPPVHSVRFA